MVVRPIWEEFALYSDCDLHGYIAAGPYEVFTIDHGRALGRGAEGAPASHVDHLPDGPPSRDAEWRADVDVYFGADLGDEFAALLGLALGRRIRSRGSVRQGLPLPGKRLRTPRSSSGASRRTSWARPGWAIARRTAVGNRAAVSSTPVDFF
jgi:hypothetical protein